MNFSDFLYESTDSYKKTIDLDKAFKLIKSNCDNTKNKEPLIRGMRGTDDAYIFEGQNGSRRSITKTNYNTIILDTVIKELNPKYPLRSASVICTTIDDIDATDRFGADKYVIFPYNDTIIGYLTKSGDLNYTRFDVNDVSYSNAMLRNALSRAKISDSSFNEIVNGIEKVLTDKTETFELLHNIFGDNTNIEQKLKDIYAPKNLGYDFGTIKDVYKDKVDGECWIGGKCIAIKYNIWKNI